MKNRKYINSYCNFEDVILEYRENGEKKQEIIKKHPWYMIVTKEDFSKLKHLEEMKDACILRSYEENGKYVKLFVENLNTKWKMDGRQGLKDYLISNNIKPLEADIFSDKRYCLDNNIEIADEYEILYFDIETDDSKPSIVIGNEQILSMAAIDRSGKIYYLTNKDEKKLLQQIVNLFNKYDIISGWNSWNFDIPYIKERMKRYEMKYFTWKSIAHLDLIIRFRHIFRSDSKVQRFSLDYIGNYFLGKGKIEHKNERIIDLYHNNPEKLKKYNIQDVVLLKDLDEKIGCINMMILQSKWCNTFISQFYISELLDNYILRVAHQNNIYCPTRNFDIQEGKYSGAYVLTPKKGLHDNVIVVDFKSLYPTIILSSNIGFDTLDDNGQLINPGTGKTFRNDKKSVIKLTIEGLIGKRKKYKELKLKMLEDGTNKGPEWERVVSDEIVVKELSNSVYGIMGKKDSRWYSLDIAESITLFGQWVIKYTENFFESKGFNVIYGDTDSLFIQGLPDDILKNGCKVILDEFHKKLSDTLKNEYNITENYIELEYEKRFDKFLMVDKKTYTGHLIEMDGKKTDQIYSRGMDYIKKSSIGFAIKLQKELINKLLFEDLDVDSCERFIFKYFDLVRNNKLKKEDVIIQTKVSQDLNKYKVDLVHVRVAKEMIKETGILETNEIQYIILDNKNKKHIIPKNYQGGYDRLYYWNQKIYPMLYRLLVLAFPNNNWDKFKLKSLVSLNQITLF